MKTHSHDSVKEIIGAERRLVENLSKPIACFDILFVLNHSTAGDEDINEGEVV